MRGLELSEKFYKVHGEPLLKSEFSSLLPYIAAGLVGGGSECLGFDDETSHDHDFEAGFCIFLPDESVVDSRSAFLLEREYARLPKEFMGYKRARLVPADGKRHGVMRISDFLTLKTGTADGMLSIREWMSLPEQNLLEVTNGKIFFDGYGQISDVRDRLSYLPDAVRRKKLAGELLLMGQAGQYNYPRCISRGETGAAQMAVHEFANSAMHAIFLLNSRYMPYYKWSFRALSELPCLAELATHLEYLISSANGEEAELKSKIIDEVASKIVIVAKDQELTSFDGDALEGHAYSINDKIHDPEVKNLHILAGV